MACDELCLEPQISEIPYLIEWLEARCRADGISDELRFKMVLAIEEGVANVINHAFAGLPPPHRITVRLDITAELVAAEIVDNGRPFDPTRAPDPDLSRPLELRDPGGLGIHLMRQMMDRFEYRSCRGNNVLRLQKARD